MVEFGEQLRRARESKGMTQQSLAEQLYVTRQAVSRWECGDRYPDLLTTKKLAQILDVSLDVLLSGKEMKKVVERNPLIENKGVNGIMISLYAFIVISYFLTIIDIILRFPIQSEVIEYADIQLLVVGILGLLIQIGLFVYGLINAIRGTLSPKRMGIVIGSYFLAMCLFAQEYLVYVSNLRILLQLILIIAPRFIGAATAFILFNIGKNKKIYYYVLYLTAMWGILVTTYTSIRMIITAGQYYSMNNTVNNFLRIAVHGLVIYQTHILWTKRQNVIDVSDVFTEDINSR